MWQYLTQSYGERIGHNFSAWTAPACKPEMHLAQHLLMALGPLLHLRSLCIWVFLLARLHGCLWCLCHTDNAWVLHLQAKELKLRAAKGFGFNIPYDYRVYWYAVSKYTYLFVSFYFFIFKGCFMWMLPVEETEIVDVHWRLYKIIPSFVIIAVLIKMKTNMQVKKCDLRACIIQSIHFFKWALIGLYMYVL